MYTWAYLKAAAFAKLDLTEDEATTQNLTGRFYIYANEVITQVCSSIKPKYTFAEFVITPDKVGVLQTMPDDFVAFGDDVNTRTYVDKNVYNTETDTFYENGKASKIDSVQVSDTKGQYGYYATWGSTDVNGTGYYKHYGWAVLDDANRPNHS